MASFSAILPSSILSVSPKPVSGISELIRLEYSSIKSEAESYLETGQKFIDRGCNIYVDYFLNSKEVDSYNVYHGNANISNHSFRSSSKQWDSCYIEIEYQPNVTSDIGFLGYGSYKVRQTITAVSAPSIPTNIYYPVSINSYNAVSISWSSVSGATSYVLERALHGSSSFTQVYSGSGTSYSDRIPSGATKAQYRVKAVNSGGSSGYKTGNLANVYYTKPNVAPTTPSSISVPSTVYGGKAFTVSWGKSTDSDGNLSGYKLEQSYNSGSTWTQVYQGSATSTSITIPFGATTRVLHRVKAYDSDGAESGYKVSSTSIVVNNNAPTTPPSITVPLTINGGKTTTITWTASTDSDGNLSGYLLERSVNGGSYTQIYKGASKSYNDNITKGWKTVQYRVCAYDRYDAKSGYRTSQKRTVVNNELPVITTASTALGLKTGAFSIKYTVSDVESQTLTVVEKINNKQKKSTSVSSGTECTFEVTQQEWISIPNGNSTLSIVATDSNGGVTTKNISFSKKENEIEFTLKTPFETDAAVSVGIMNVVRNIPEGANFTVEVCNNGYDQTPKWEDVTKFVKENRNFVLLNNTKTAEKWGYSFKVKVQRGQATGDCYIIREYF